MTRPFEALIFDLDGTLFRTETLLLPAYQATFDQLRKEGLHAGDTPPEERILGALGLLLEEIWERVIPDSSPQVRRRANELLLEFQLCGLAEGAGDLYEGVAETLTQLRVQGYQLFVASNGLEGYVKGVIGQKGLSELFTSLYSAGEFQTATKADLVGMLLDRHKIESACMVGDRSSDVEAGKANGLFVIGCGYADFGHREELAGADLVIQTFPDLLNVLKKIRA